MLTVALLIVLLYGYSPKPRSPVAKTGENVVSCLTHVWLLMVAFEFTPEHF